MANALKEFAVLLFVINICYAVPITEKQESEKISNNNTTNNGKDLYVIKTIVYEVGILTDATNKTDNETETHEEIDLTFFDPKNNGSTFDLSNIPFPIETNISGVSITGIVPINFGKLELPSETEESATLLNFPLDVPVLPNALVNVERNLSASDELTQAQVLEKFPELFDNNYTINGIPLQVLHREMSPITTFRSEPNINVEQHDSTITDS